LIILSNILIVNPIISDADPLFRESYEIATYNNRFAFKLYSSICTESSENILISPFSISAALAMTYEEAHDVTAEQIQIVFQFPDDDHITRTGFQELFDMFNSDQSEYDLSIANAL